MEVDDEGDIQKILETLPQWRTEIRSISKSGDEIEMLKIKVAATCEEEIKEWIQEYEEISMCNYSVQTRSKCTGMKVQFKEYLRCQHHTRCSRTYDTKARNRTKNTNCPSRMIVTLYTIKESYKRRDIPDPEMPCEIILIPQHNHSTNSVESLKFRKVSKETEEKLLKLFNLGHSARSALELLKAEIVVNNEDYEVAFADRRFCPSYNHCYYLYNKYVEKKFNTADKNKTLIMDLIKKYNNKTKTNSIHAEFIGTDDYVICLCPPLLRRVHEYIRQASKIVLMDSFEPIGRNKNKVYILFTYCECGELPLAVIITSKESSDMLITGLNTLKEMMGPNLFGGNIDGPLVFITNDSEVEQSAIQTVFAKSRLFLNSSQILCETWKWLRNINNKIHPTDQPKFYGDFKSVMYARSSLECEYKYCIALKNAVAYPNYQTYLKDFWKRKEKWVLIYRDYISTDKLYLNNFSKMMIDLLRKKLFQNSKAGTLPYLINITSINLIDYYQMKLCDAAQNILTAESILFNLNVTLPPADYLDKIDVMENIYFIPSGSSSNVSYMTDIEALMCTCPEAGLKKLCEHIHWIYYLKISKQYVKQIDDIKVQNLFYMIVSTDEEDDVNESDSIVAEQDTSNEIINDTPEITSPPESTIQEIEFNSENAGTFDPIENSIDHTSSEMGTPQEQVEENEEADLEETIEKGKQLIQDISDIQYKFLLESPVEMLKLLTNMKKNYERCKTSAAFTSSVTSGIQKKVRKRYITALQRKTSLLPRGSKYKSKQREQELAEDETQKTVNQLHPEIILNENSYYF